MSFDIYLRTLKIEDAATSYIWRNNPEIWKYTKFNPLLKVTLDVESKWLKRVLHSKEDKRFAICLKSNHQYIGNIHFINVKDKQAELHLFIGEVKLWGKGIATEAIKQMLILGFEELKLKNILLEVHEDNFAAKKIYKKLGFKHLKKEGFFINMSLKKKDFLIYSN